MCRTSGLVSLTGPGWDQVPVIKIQHYWSGELAPIDRHAEAQVCWSDESLNVRFVCTQREPFVIAQEPIVDKKTLGLWDRDVCEIFVAPDAENPHRYFEFEAAPTGEWVDLGILITPDGRETDWDYQSGMRVKTRIDGERLMILMGFPDTINSQTSSGNRVASKSVSLCWARRTSRYLAWQPTGTPEPNFHVPGKFGWLHFT